MSPGAAVTWTITSTTTARPLILVARDRNDHLFHLVGGTVHLAGCTVLSKPPMAHEIALCECFMNIVMVAIR